MFSLSKQIGNFEFLFFVGGRAASPKKQCKTENPKPFLFFWLFKASNKLEKWGILIIIAGAISNIGDRFINNYVLDFIFLHYKQYYWPAFNFADIYISTGVLLIIIENYKMFKTRLKGNND